MIRLLGRSLRSKSQYRLIGLSLKLIVRSFPREKSGWSQARVRSCAEGPTQSMSIASYELAEPLSEGNDIQSVFAPESAA